MFATKAVTNMFSRKQNKGFKKSTTEAQHQNLQQRSLSQHADEMSLPSWQERAVESDGATLVNKSFRDARKFFAVDASSSTSGSIMKQQKKSVQGLHGHSQNYVTRWNNVCDVPRLVDGAPTKYYSGYGGTSPDCILKQPAAVSRIHGSELWVLLTDGEISDSSVIKLTQSADDLGVTNVPVILLITCDCNSSPVDTNISVGISFFASAREALILCKDYKSGKLFVIDAKGAFEPLKSPEPGRATQSEPLMNWGQLRVFANEAALKKACSQLDIVLRQSDGRQNQKAVSLGSEWDLATGNILVNVPDLLTQRQLKIHDLRNLLAEETITQLALISKTRGQLGDLRGLLLRHKQQDMVIHLADRHGAGKIMEQIRKAVNSEDKNKLMEQLRQAHAANRSSYQKLKDSPSEESRIATESNKLINRGLAIIAGFEKSLYTAEILNRKSNRAMRSEIVSADDAEIHFAALNLSNDVDAFRGTCSICCGEDQIMSVVLKKLDSVEENTTDFALNFPLAAGQAKQNANMISSQSICFQCALLCEKSTFNEEIAATIPSLDYNGPNKTYIDHQLTLAITAGLATGASGTVQIFTTILDRTLETKGWCSRDRLEDLEVSFRRQLFEWTLNDLLRRSQCRENFSETGRWVQYPQALSWAVMDYRKGGLDSWIIQYPTAGFNQLLRWYEILELAHPKALESIKQAKLIHLTTTSMMTSLLREKNSDDSWKYPFLSLIYKSFNTPGVPCDLGQTSIVSADRFWSQLEAALGSWSDVKRFLGLFTSSERLDMAHRIQIVTFWALYTQKGHTMPKTFFANIKSREPLAPLVLDPSIPISESAVRDVLMSIFCPAVRLEAQRAHCDEMTLPPFVSPYGPSVLHCGKPKCPVKFFSAEDDPIDPIRVREQRAKHLVDIYGAGPASASQTGLPAPTRAPIAPNSYLNNLHVSTARTWSRLSYKEKKAIANGSTQGDHPAVLAFTKDVRLEICANNHRGNIYSASIEEEVREILPSLLEALRDASQKVGLKDRSGLGFEHDWTQNTIVWKMKYELSL